MRVLRQFIAGANAQYRAAGLDEYQLRVRRDGSVVVPRRTPRLRAGSAAADQARTGATSAAPATAAAPAAAAAPGSTRSGPAPRPTDLKQVGADAFRISWQPVEGAKQYGIWQDGRLIGHVSSPSFAAQLADGASGIVQIDAVRADGTRSALTPALRVTRRPDGSVGFDVPGAAQAGAAQPGVPPVGAAAPAPAVPAAATPASATPTAPAAPAG